VVRLQAKNSSLALLQSAPSAADGTFRVVNVPAGTYFAVGAIPVAIRNGNSTITSMDFPTAGGLLAAPEVVVQAGDVTGVRGVVNQP
jgi:hypothetical protein